MVCTTWCCNYPKSIRRPTPGEGDDGAYGRLRDPVHRVLDAERPRRSAAAGSRSTARLHRCAFPCSIHTFRMARRARCALDPRQY